jgi:hypothetical protein
MANKKYDPYKKYKGFYDEVGFDNTMKRPSKFGGVDLGERQYFKEQQEVGDPTPNTSSSFSNVTDVTPASDNTYRLGATDKYWNALYVKNIYLNSTAYISGATGGSLSVYGDLKILNSSGTKIGTTASEKLALWGNTPIVQPSGANQSALTNSTGGTYDGTLADVTATHNQAILNSNFTDLFTLLNEIRTVLVNTGIMKGSA